LLFPSNFLTSVIAVTGLAGHAFGSWRAKGGSAMWLRDFLPKDIPNIRVLIYGFDSKLEGKETTAGLSDYTTSFLQGLKTIQLSNVVNSMRS
jgi:hypothetical protein